MAHTDNLTGYSKKAAEGSRPFIYSDAYYAWRKSLGSRDENSARDRHDAFLVNAYGRRH